MHALATSCSPALSLNSLYLSLLVHGGYVVVIRSAGHHWAKNHGPQKLKPLARVYCVARQVPSPAPPAFGGNDRNSVAPLCPRAVAILWWAIPPLWKQLPLRPALNPQSHLLSPPPLPLLPPLHNCTPLAGQQFPAGCRLLPQRYPCGSAPFASPCLSLLGHQKEVVALHLVAPPLPLILFTSNCLSMHRLVVALPLIAPPLLLVLMACPCLSMHRLCHPSS